DKEPAVAVDGCGCGLIPRTHVTVEVDVQTVLTLRNLVHVGNADLVSQNPLENREGVVLSLAMIHDLVNVHIPRLVRALHDWVGGAIDILLGDVLAHAQEPDDAAMRAVAVSARNHTAPAMDGSLERAAH